MLITILSNFNARKRIRLLKRQVYHIWYLKNYAVIISLLLFCTIGCRGKKQAQPTPQMDIAEDYWVRVLLENDVNSCEIWVNGDFTINCPQLGVDQHFKDIRKPLELSYSQGSFIFAGKVFSCQKVTITPDNPHVFSINGNKYRGRLMIIGSPELDAFDIINVLPPQAYLAGVLAAEMPDYWEPEALNAQAIAARTYCFYIKQRFGRNRDWDLGKTAAHQVYLGLKAESQTAWDAVNQTEGMVLTCKNEDSNETIFPSYYSSTCGGHTENSVNVFGDSWEPLGGVPCPFCKDVAKPSVLSWPAVQFSKKEVTEKLFSRYPELQGLGDIENISIYKKSDYDDFSRATLIHLYNSTGSSESVRAEDFRLTVDPSGAKIKSSGFVIEDNNDVWSFTNGRGYGHGVGMCQYGAEGMARQGYTAEQILNYYYPDSKIEIIEYLKQ